MFKCISVVFSLTGCAVLCGCQSEAEETYNFKQEGKASYYADVLAGEATASGEAYHPDSLTAAHRHLPLGTDVLVINPQNQRQIRLRINDRGPFHEERMLDISRYAADSLGFLEEGVAQVILHATLSPQLADSLTQLLTQDTLSAD